ncbi:hypothetical protein BAUCODRAFT_22628 [Baudoinia panamericana UAMH 10762]|uniref:DUF8212 domain-containing protein n=1 Tax=Baudoinia panamericana (strain UAMH 10762) TaxID=717646 RepID=M2NJ25_BAUPA|nr:uncharacterized protein BAUCODRAFT_22628 [Baudoinia panamericana UAMH 10762]EMC99394.1 hypothetical protein BAUCODRAFT_22628 [Baudoinia panamericana UAMH 10762]
MRLIDTETLQFVETFDVQGSEYAILSHHWQADEVSYEEYELTLRPREMLTVKLERSRATGRSWNSVLGHAYVVTERPGMLPAASTSGAVLNFRRRLTQFGIGFHDDNQLLRHQLRQSTWFTRSWILQELLAPYVLEFCNSEWETVRLLDKLFCLHAKHQDNSSLSVNPTEHWIAELQAITGIDCNIFRGAEVATGASVAQKMSWAAPRTATWVEDIAYSLMGLLQINIPLLYGEGEKAFTRLHLEVVKQSDDQSIFAWRAQKTDWPCRAVSHERCWGFGVLATSPQDFAHSGAVVDYSDMEFSIAPQELLDIEVQPAFTFTATNRGMELKIEAYKVMEHDTSIVSSHSTAGLRMARFGSSASWHAIRILISGLNFMTSWRRMFAIPIAAYTLAISAK